jgi:hypothetical protein
MPSRLLRSALIAAAVLTACGPAKSTTDAGTPADSGVPCVMNPMTHLEIINACTDAQGIDKHPTLPLLLPDGGLPPLP